MALAVRFLPSGTQLSSVPGAKTDVRFRIGRTGVVTTPLSGHVGPASLGCGITRDLVGLGQQPRLLESVSHISQHGRKAASRPANQQRAAGTSPRGIGDSVSKSYAQMLQFSLIAGIPGLGSLR